MLMLESHLFSNLAHSFSNWTNLVKLYNCHGSYKNYKIDYDFFKCTQNYKNFGQLNKNVWDVKSKSWTTMISKVFYFGPFHVHFWHVCFWQSTKIPLYQGLVTKHSKCIAHDYCLNFNLKSITRNHCVVLLICLFCVTVILCWNRKSQSTKQRWSL